MHALARTRTYARTVLLPLTMRAPPTSTHQIRRQRVRAPGAGGAGGGELSWTVYSFHATDPSLSDAGALAELSAVDGTHARARVRVCAHVRLGKLGF